MSVAQARADLAPGNARLRARRTALLGPDRVARLTGRDLEGLIGELRGTAYGRHLDIASADRRAALLAAITAVRRELLRSVLAVHRGPAAHVVGPLMAPYDVADVLTLVRGAAHDLPDEQVLDAIDAVGAVEPAVARHVVADDPEVVVPRLVAAHLPDPVTARVLPAAWERYLRHGDLAELELTVGRAAAHAQALRLAPFGARALTVRSYLAAGQDIANVVTAMRLRASRADDTAIKAALLPVGTIDERTLLALASGALNVGAIPPALRARLGRMSGMDDLPGLAQDLQAVRLAAGAARYRAGDPLGDDVPVGFVAGVEAEALALRRLVLSASSAAYEGQAA